MNCPRCEGAVLEEKEREGVTVDVCRGCRGIWLDRGELEKIVARSADDIASRERRSRDDDDDDDDDDHDRRDRRGPGGERREPRRRGWFEGLGDLFD